MANTISHMRRAGVLLHPTSLPSGKLDKQVFAWLDFMQNSSLSIWQMLPLGVPQENLSPYQCYSAFAINPALLPESENIVIANADSSFNEWMKEQSYWLRDYALFMVLKEVFNDAAWYQWPDEFKHHHANALAVFTEQQQESIQFIYQEQFHLYRIWQNIRQYAAERDILLLGDMPIFIAHDSADVWANPNEFLLDENGYPTLVAGVPPDYFSATGQRWGNPHYDWEYMKNQGFSWWLQRIASHFEWFDWVRIDHFRGLEASWMINAESETAMDGYWQQVPGDDMLNTLQSNLGKLPLIAEDLGVITPEVVALRKKYQLPGMAVLQFSFDDFADNPHKPENIEQDTVAYTGTHDNDTSKGWYLSLSKDEQQRVQQRLGLANADPDQLVLALMNTAMATAAGMVIIPLQDFLLLDSSGRMNTPGVSEGNWQWQIDGDQLTSDLSKQITNMVQANQRLPDVGERHVK